MGTGKMLSITVKIRTMRHPRESNSRGAQETFSWQLLDRPALTQGQKRMSLLPGDTHPEMPTLPQGPPPSSLPGVALLPTAPVPRLPPHPHPTCALSVLHRSHTFPASARLAWPQGTWPLELHSLVAQDLLLILSQLCRAPVRLQAL